MKIKKNFGRIIISLIVSIVAFIGLLVVQQTILTPNGTSKVYIATENIEKGTIMTTENVDKLFKEKNVDGELKVTNAITSKKVLVDKIANKDVEKGAVISSNTFTHKDDILAKIKTPVEVSIKVDDISQAVGGILRAGDIINISVVNLITKENEKIFENTYVNKVFSKEGKEIKREDISSVVTINLIISKEDEAKLNKAIELGVLRISKVD
jgi:hypothetical protein